MKESQKASSELEELQMMYEYDPVRIRKVLGDKVQFIQGDMAICYGGILAGVSFFGGYPIT